MTQQEQQTPAVAIVGAGATGGYLAARLTRAGIPVTLVARGETARALRDGGIDVTDEQGTWRATPARVIDTESSTDTGAATQAHDLVVICVKTYDMDAVLPAIEWLAGADGYVLSLQNGVSADELLSAEFGGERCLSGVLYIGANRTSRTAITCTAPPRILVGPSRADGDIEPAEYAYNIFEDADIECTVDPQILTAKWQKFLLNCGLNPLTALTGMRMGALLAIPETRSLFADLIYEAASVATAADAPLAPDAVELAIATGARMDISSSMAEDLVAKRPLELDAFTGHVLNLAHTHRIATPATRTMHALLTAASQSSV